MSSTASWVFDLVDVNGSPLLTGGMTDFTTIEIAEAEGGAPTSAVVTIDNNSDAAGIVNAATNDDSDIQVYLKGYRSTAGGTAADRVLRIYAPLIVDEVQNTTTVATFVEPLEILSQRFTDGQFVPTDLGELIFDMIDATNSTDGDTGILVDNLNIVSSSSIDIDARTNIPSIASLIDQFFKMLDGVEVWTRPMELAAGKTAQLFASPQRGSESNAVFGYGDGTLANCDGMGRIRSIAPPFGNDQRGFADGLTMAQATNDASIAAFRRRIQYTSMTGETSQTVLQSRTQGLVDRFGSKRAIASYSAVPNIDAPRLYDDFDIGDSATLDFRDGQTEWQATSQVISSAKIVVDENGHETPGAVTFRKPR